MELGICYKYNQNICGVTDQHISNQYIIYETFPYSKINTRKLMKRKFRFVNSFNSYLALNGNINDTTIDFIKRVELIDSNGCIVSCAIYYTYLLKIIQRRWRRFLQYRKIYLSSYFINHLRKRELSGRISKVVRDGDMYGLLYK